MNLAENIAYIYVNYGIPAFQAFLLFMVVMAVIYVVSFIKEPSKQIDMATKFFHWVVGSFIAIVVGLSMGVFQAFRFVFRVINVIFSTLRDFFMSRI